jgi:dTDP-4-dehydrorhamnose reductase
MENTHARIDRRKLVITGLDTVVGANLAVALADRCSIVGISKSRLVRPDGCGAELWNSDGPGKLGDLVIQENPEWIVHCGPFARSSWDVPQEVPDAEAEAAKCRLLVDLARQTGAQLTVLSTDAVFAGPRLFHAETAPVSNQQPFALSARYVEQTLEGAGTLVVRTHAYGWTPADCEPCIGERIWRDLTEASEIWVPADRHATPILATDLAEFLWLAYRHQLTGLCHIAGAERTSAYRFAAELASSCGLGSAPGRRGNLPSYLPADTCLAETSLSSRLAQQTLHRPMPMLREGLDRFIAQARNGHRARLQRGAWPVPAAA